MRYDRRIRYFASILFIVGMVIYLPVAIYMPALLFNQVSGIGVHIITPIICLICTFYTCVGGLKAVIWTDVIQSILMYGTVLVICIKGTIDIGGLGVVLQRNADGGRLNMPDLTWDPTVRLSMLSVLVGGTLHKIQSTDVNQITIQRFMSLPTLKKVKQTMVLYTIMLTCLLSCSCYIGVLAYATYYDCDPVSTKLARATDQLPAVLVMRILGAIPGMPGLFIAGVFSAALSSLSTGLNSLSCVISQDIVKPLIRQPLSERQMGIIMRLIVVVFGVACIALIFIVEKLGMILQLSTMTSAVTMGPLLGIYIMGICLPWINTKSALTGSLISFLCTCWLCANAQLAQLNGEIRHPKLPVSVEGCTYTYDNVTMWSETRDYIPSAERNIYHLSFLWYTAFGGVISLIASGLASFYFGTAQLDEIDPQLISPLMQRFLPKAKHYTNYFERRFSRRVRLFGATLFVLKAIIWLPIAIYVPALTFNQVSGIDIHTITPIVIIICTFYTTVGGIKGVIWTDVIQSILMFGAIIVLMIKGTYDLGGFDVVWQRNLEGGRLITPELTLDPTVRLSVFSVFIGGTIFKLQSTSINQVAVQRFMSLPSLQKIKQSLVIFSIGLTLLYLCCVYVGLVTYATYYDCDPMSTGLARARDQLVPLLVMRVLGTWPGLPGLFVSGVFSAALSSLSTLLNSLSAVILEDFVKPHMKSSLSERHTAIIMRFVVVLFGISSIALVYVVEKLGMVLQLSATLQSILYGPMLGIFAMGMLMPWINEKSILMGSIISVSCMAWICINAQVANVTGSFRHTKLPISIDGCDYEFDMGRYLNSTADYQTTKGSAIYHISFLWYSTLGALLTIICSIVGASIFFGWSNIADVDEKLLAPFVVRLLKRYGYQRVQRDEKIELNDCK